VLLLARHSAIVLTNQKQSSSYEHRRQVQCLCWHLQISAVCNVPFLHVQRLLVLHARHWVFLRDSRMPKTPRGGTRRGAISWAEQFWRQRSKEEGGGGKEEGGGGKEEGGGCGS
jgi:hypothetical protein